MASWSTATIDVSMIAGGLCIPRRSLESGAVSGRIARWNSVNRFVKDSKEYTPPSWIMTRRFKKANHRSFFKRECRWDSIPARSEGEELARRLRRTPTRASHRLGRRCPRRRAAPGQPRTRHPPRSTRHAPGRGGPATSRAFRAGLAPRSSGPVGPGPGRRLSANRPGGLAIAPAGRQPREKTRNLA